MVSRHAVRRALLGRHVAVAYAIVVVLYLLRFVEFPPVQIPAYLLIVAYDFVETALPFLTPYHPVGFPLFLYALAVVGAAVARRRRPDEGRRATWTRTLGGVCVLIGVLSLGFGAVVAGPLVSATDNPTPLAITGGTGVVCLVIGWWLLGRPGTSVPTRS